MKPPLVLCRSQGALDGDRSGHTLHSVNSPFLLILSVIWIPIFYIFCWTEERDLVIRCGDPYLGYKKNTVFLIPKRNVE